MLNALNRICLDTVPASLIRQGRADRGAHHTGHLALSGRPLRAVIASPRCWTAAHSWSSSTSVQRKSSTTTRPPTIKEVGEVEAGDVELGGEGIGRRRPDP